MPHSIINITTDIIFILLHFFLLLFSYYLLGKKYFQPAFLFSFTWLWILILHFIFRFTLLDKLEALHGNVYFIFFIGNLFFLLGSFLADSRFKNNLLKRTVTQQIQVSTNFKLRLILTVILLLGLPFYIQAAFKIFLASQAENFFSGLRSELVYGEANIGVLKYLVPLAYVVYAFNLYDYYIKKNNRNRVLVILTLLALFTYAVFATGRIPFLMILCIHLGVSLFANTNFSIKKYLALFGIFVIFFMVVGILSGKGGSTEDSRVRRFRRARTSSVRKRRSPCPTQQEPSFSGGRAR